MLRASQPLDRQSAIRLAKAYLQKRNPLAVANSHITADHIAGEQRERKLAELVAFVESENQSSRDVAQRFGLQEDHWCVRFFPICEEGSATTIPPTILRVYDTDGHIEVEGS